VESPSISKPSESGQTTLSNLAPGLGGRPPAATTLTSFAVERGKGRDQAESLVAAVFARAYAARVRSFLPTLMGLRAADRGLLAVCGLRPAASGPLFLERYLDQAVEIALGNRSGGPARRDRIVEVGNLAVSRPGFAPALIRALTAHLARGETEWVVFTAVPALRNAFAKLRVPLLPLGEADPVRLTAAERQDWGTYYASHPQVTAVRVATAHEALFPSSPRLTMAA
jgi:hypothetical protein